MKEDVIIDKQEIAKLSVELQKDLAQGMVNEYLRGETTLVDLLTNARYYGLEHLIDWDNLSKPKHLIEG